MPEQNPVFSHSPLQRGACVGSHSSVRLATLPDCLKISVRGDAEDAAFVAAVENVTGLSVPTSAGTASADAHGILLWLGPDEWQWRRPTPDTRELDATSVAAAVARFESHLAGIHSAVVDISNYYILLELCGPQTFAVLEKGTPLNLRQYLGQPGQCAQTRFGTAAVLLNRTDATPETVQIQVRWSFAEYLWQYLSQAMLEFD